MDIPALVDEIFAWANRKGWWDREEDRDIPTKLALIHSELSEALEEYRHGRMKLWYHYAATDQTPENVGLHSMADGLFFSVTPFGDHTSFGQKLIPATHEKYLEFGYEAKPEGFGIEIADAVIRICDLAGWMKAGNLLAEWSVLAPMERNGHVNVGRSINDLHDYVSKASELQHGTSGLMWARLGDVVRWSGWLCSNLDNDLDEMIRIKMAYNETREFRHGNRVI
jgi:hypothetical protein